MDDKKEQSFKDSITIDIIQPNYIHEITSFISARSEWRKVGLLFETISKILLGIGSILSFASGIYTNQNMSFISGSVSTLSLVCFQFATFAFRESKKSTEKLNIILKKLKLDSIPEVLDAEDKTINNVQKQIIPQDTIVENK